jgi:hypothetical protein
MGDPKRVSGEHSPQRQGEHRRHRILDAESCGRVFRGALRDGARPGLDLPVDDQEGADDPFEH